MLETYFPAAAGESAFSLLATAAATSSKEEVHHMVAVAFRRCAPILYTVPCRLEKFSRLTNYVYGSPKDVLIKHTLFHFFCCGMPASFQNRLEDQLIVKTVARTCAAKLPVFVECGNRFGLDCPQCTAGMLETIGRRASLCRLCLPFITRCPIHQCRLTVTDSCSRMELAFAARQVKAAKQNSLCFAKTELTLAGRDPNVDLRDELNRMLVLKRYMTDTGRVRLSDISRDFSAYYSGQFEDLRLNALLANQNLVGNICTVLRRNDRCIHPVYLSLLHLFLSNCDSNARAIYSRTNHKPTGKIRTYSPTRESTLRRRKEWISHCKENRLLTRTEIRHCSNGLWTWLYRYDRKWLCVHQKKKALPKNGRVVATPSPGIKDLLCCQATSVAVNPLLPPQLRSRYQTRLHLCISDYQLTQILRGLPPEIVEQRTVQARSVFVSDRLQWSVNYLSSHGQPINLSAVARRASLRQETIFAHWPQNNTTFAGDPYHASVELLNAGFNRKK